MPQPLQIFHPRHPNFSIEKRYISALVQDKFFTVTFYKADGKLRTLNGRLGVTKHIKHFKERVTNRHHSKYLVVYDVHAKGYRNVDVTNITSIKIDGYEHVTLDNPTVSV
jgi:hypothetical protein